MQLRPPQSDDDPNAPERPGAAFALTPQHMAEADFQALAKNGGAWMMKTSALLRAGRILMRQVEVDFTYLIDRPHAFVMVFDQAMMLAAMAAENALKGLIAISEIMAPPNGHDLVKLAKRAKFQPGAAYVEALESGEFWITLAGRYQAAQRHDRQPANSYADMRLFELFEKLLTAVVREAGARIHAAPTAKNIDGFERWCLGRAEVSATESRKA